MYNKLFGVLLCPFITLGQVCFAQTDGHTHFTLDVPLVELPYNTDHGYSALSMQQSLRLTKSFYYGAHRAIEKASIKWLGKRGKFWSRVIISVADFTPVPLSGQWMHEEWHRAVLATHNIKSKNAHWQGMVTKVNDEDLQRLKESNPADMVRESTAGNGSQLELVFALERDRFFDRTHTWNYPLYWGHYLVNWGYLFASTRKSGVAKGLQSLRMKEGRHIHARDANGFDPINAVYDLFNQNEPYDRRGLHPSGVGIDRYIEFSDLSAEAQSFLKQQTRLSLLNFIDPNLIGFHQFGNGLKWNASLRHHLTSFGLMVGGNVFLKKDQWGLTATLQRFSNHDRSFSGLDVKGHYKWIDLRLAAWQQPKDQQFFTSDKQTGGLLGLKLAYPKHKWRPYAELDLKSQGWVAGNPYLSRNFTGRLGIEWTFHKGD